MTIFYQVAGDGPTVLLVHAGVADSRMWARQVDELRGDHRVITVDLRGFGETPLEAGAKYADAGDVLAVLDELGVESTKVVGSSYGAYVVLQAASRQPERFSRLVLLPPPADDVVPTDDFRAFAGEENRLLDAGDIDGATELNVRTSVGPEADDAARELVRVMQRRAFEVQLAAGDVDNEEWEVGGITAPIKLFTGAHELTFFAACAKHLSEILPTVDHTELPWAGHLPSFERPEEMTALIRAALA
ncbi:alpha/beta hydrolase [Streptomyces sp. SID13031]|uniref:alpha/beta fold hydrolase n=1 Tax=Streptomyces sp. SID13031 TaxID=2706046 RepID=UPI0013C6DD29|nr:alpha/beta hydrolase [Streptomyces sp. SID13031]NEA31630.1 alpha/beta hydrolase [Streptomyces sp. SID13031]